VRLKELKSLIHRHFEIVRNVFSLISYSQGLAIITPTAAAVTGNINVWQKMHLNFFYSSSLALLTAPSMDIEAKAARSVALSSGFWRHSQQLSQRAENLGIGGRIRARRSPYGLLVNQNDFVNIFQAF